VDKLIKEDREVKSTAWSKIWSWTSQSQVLRDVIHASIATRDAAQAYAAIRSHFELTTVHEKATLLESQLNGALTLVKFTKSADSGTVKRLQTHIAQISNRLANLQPPQEVPDTRKLTLFRGGLPAKFNTIVEIHKAVSPDDSFLEHSGKVIQDIVAGEIHKAVEAQHDTSTSRLPNALSTNPPYYPVGADAADVAAVDAGTPVAGEAAAAEKLKGSTASADIARNMVTNGQIAENA
jgi:hypothetical protein